MARTIWRDPQRYLDAYWRTYAGAGADGQGYFLAGDGASYDADGDIWLLGRLDDVINVSGHRLSTIEVESALVAHPGVGEAGVAGVDDPVTGQAITAFVIPSRAPAALDDTAAWRAASAAVQEELRAHVATAIGPVAKPRRVVLVPDLPKTRSGKIMRRLLAQVHDRTTLGDVTSLQNAHVLDQIHHLLHGDADVPVPQPDRTTQPGPVQPVELAQQDQHDTHDTHDEQDTQHHATKELSR